jgi:hypothetical protein
MFLTFFLFVVVLPILSQDPDYAFLFPAQPNAFFISLMQRISASTNYIKVRIGHTLFPNAKTNNADV